MDCSSAQETPSQLFLGVSDIGNLSDDLSHGLVLDPSNRSKLSMDEKKEIVCALSNWSHGAPEMLQSWSRKEILEILCAESGKERKHTGLTKSKIIENLLKTVSEKKSNDRCVFPDFEQKPSTGIAPRNPKRQRKIYKPAPFSAKAIQSNNTVVLELDLDDENRIFCKNSACKARVSQNDVFCKRCSCCICYKYDDNKDPSLWLTCSPEPIFLGESCGLSCHLECALSHERSGIGAYKLDKSQDGSFYCVSCGKENDVIGPCRKQLLTAKETRRVDILCYRVSLSQKILCGTKNYQNLCNIVNEALKRLEEDVGPLTGLPVKNARGVVSRLCCGSEVQRLCGSAIECLDYKISERAYILSDYKDVLAKLVILEDVSASSATGTIGSECSSLGNVVGYNLWHRKADDLEYPAQPTCLVFAPHTKFFIPGLTPETEYVLKVVSLGRNRELGMHEIRLKTISSRVDVSDTDFKTLQVGKGEDPTAKGSSISNLYSVEDETTNDIPCNNDGEAKAEIYLDNNTPQKMAPENRSTSGYLHEIDRGTTPLTTFQKENQNVGSLPFIDSKDLEGKSSPDTRTIGETSTDENGSNTPTQAGQESIPFPGTSEALLPITPCKVDNTNTMPKRSCKPRFSSTGIHNGSRKEEPHGGSSSKKRSRKKLGNESAQDGKDFEYYVKVIWWLELDGHIETGFRQKFLTWYSRRATKQEAKIVRVFVDTFMEDPASLAAQLIDTFLDIISNNKSTIVPGGFCLKLWH